MRQCNVTFMWKVNFEEKNPGSSVPKFSSLVILQRLQHLIIQFPLCYLLVVAYGRLKTEENFKLLALKVVTVVHERWSLTRGSQCRDLAEKLWYFGKLVAEERWSLARGGRNRRFDCICCNMHILIEHVHTSRLRTWVRWTMGQRHTPLAPHRITIQVHEVHHQTHSPHSQTIPQITLLHIALKYIFIESKTQRP